MTRMQVSAPPAATMPTVHSGRLAAVSAMNDESGSFRFGTVTSTKYAATIRNGYMNMYNGMMIWLRRMVSYDFAVNMNWYWSGVTQKPSA